MPLPYFGVYKYFVKRPNTCINIFACVCYSWCIDTNSTRLQMEKTMGSRGHEIGTQLVVSMRNTSCVPVSIPWFSRWPMREDVSHGDDGPLLRAGRRQAANQPSLRAIFSRLGERSHRSAKGRPAGSRRRRACRCNEGSRLLEIARQHGERRVTNE